MSVPYDAAVYLQTNGYGTFAANTLQVGTLKPTPDTTISLRQSGGMEPVRTMRKPMAANRPELQVVVRGPKNSWQVTQLKAANILALLDNFVGLINGTYYLHFRARSAELDLGVDEDERVIFGINFLVTVRNGL